MKKANLTQLNEPMARRCILSSLALIHFLVAGSGLSAAATVTLPAILSDHMVLQRDKKVCIWGKAAPSEFITVEIDGQKKSISADKSGNWQLTLNPLRVGAPRELTIKGSNSIVLHDVEVGDVWLCSGQSNLLTPIVHSDADHADLADVDQNKIRMFYMHGVLNAKGAVSDRGAWQTIDKASLSKLTTPAIPYLFARGIQRLSKVSSAVVVVACGGSPLETFFPPDTARKLHKPPPTVLPPFKISANYWNYLHPIRNFTSRGVIWYQGESNFVDASEYGRLFPLFITDWRKQMSDPLVPFYFVQVPNHGIPMKQPGDAFWADLREAQSKARALPNVHMVVSIDTVTENPAPLHAKEKRQIASRLVALVKSVDFDNVMDTGSARFKQTIKGNRILIDVDGAHKNPTIKDGETAQGFQIAGSDRKFFWATARINGSSIVVSSDKVKAPVAVRYAWADNPACNVRLGDLPLPPFRTDNWPTHPKLNDEDWPKNQ
jgi:sialate O-acetylesterase